MSTRGLVVLKDKENFASIFNKWDSYPGVLGKDIFSICKELKTNLDLLKRNIKICDGTECATRFDDMQELLLKALRKEVLVHDCFDFGYDSCFCEWAYLVDFKKEEMTVFKGLNSQRLAKDALFYKEVSDARYFGVKEVTSIKFTDVVDFAMFEASCAKKEQPEC